MIEDLNRSMLFSPAYGEQSLRVTQDEFIEDKVLKKYIRNIERLVRTSPEYKNWLTFIHGVLGSNFCCYHTGEDYGCCSIQIHHHPLTLYDYVVICLENCTKFDTFNIAEEVMALHFENYVGFVPLCSTSHEKYHSNTFVIPIDVVEGNWQGFLKEYESRIPEYIINNAMTAATVTLNEYPYPWFMRQKNYVNVNVQTSIAGKEVIPNSRIGVKEDWI